MSATIAEAATIIDRANKPPKRRRTSEQEREKKRRLVERKRAEQLAKAIEEANEIEAESERRAFLLASIETPTMVLRGPRIRIVEGRIERGPDLSFVPRRSRAAVIQFQHDWQDAGAGLGSGSSNYTGAGGGGDQPIIGRDHAMLAQITIRTRLEGAMRELGADFRDLIRVVIECVPIPVWAAEHPANPDPDEAVRMILAIFARLADFYSPRRDVAREPRSLTLGPSRETYHTTPDYPGEKFDERGRLYP